MIVCTRLGVGLDAPLALAGSGGGLNGEAVDSLLVANSATTSDSCVHAGGSTMSRLRLRMQFLVDHLGSGGLPVPDMETAPLGAARSVLLDGYSVLVGLQLDTRLGFLAVEIQAAANHYDQQNGDDGVEQSLFHGCARSMPAAVVVGSLRGRADQITDSHADQPGRNRDRRDGAGVVLDNADGGPDRPAPFRRCSKVSGDFAHGQPISQA